MDKELRILILEDVPADAELEEHELRKAGLVFILKIVDTREAFLKALDEFSPDLILSDYEVPSFDGLAALRIAKEKCPDVPFILVTGKLGEEFAIEILKEGATDYVLKNNLKRLAPSVNRALEEAKLITERRRAEEALKKETLQRSILMDRSLDGIAIINQEHELVEANQRFAEMLGYTPKEVIGLHTWDWEANMTEAEIRANFVDLTKTNVVFETRHRRKDGTIYDVEVSASGAKVGDEPMVFTISRDITERKRAAEALEKRIVALTRPLDDAKGITFEELFNLDDIQRLQDEFARATGVASIITHPDGTPITAPSNFCRLCNDIIRKTDKGRANCFRSDAVIGLPSAHGPTIQPCMSGGLWDAGAGISVGGRHIANWLIGQVRDSTQNEDKIRAYAGEIGADEAATVEAFREAPAMSHERFRQVAQVLFTLANQLSATAYQNVQQARFITERKKAEERIEYLAYYDALTGLPNRNLFIDRLKQGVARAEPTAKIVAVLIADIDRFKSINDAYGTEVGDKVLNNVAERLSAAVSEGDIIARLGNDEFGIALFDIANLDEVNPVMEKIMKHISHPLKIGSDEIASTFSVGISIYPHDGKNPQDLLKSAGLALGIAKKEGRKTCQFYSEDLNVKASECLLMEKNLNNAIKNEEFILHYQPYWDINTKKMTGMEALVRWQSPELGLVSPARFIPVLEDTGMIIEAGEWILGEAMRQVKEWQNNGYPVVPVSVNLSLIQFRQKDLAGMIKKIMKDRGYYPSLLTLEITESAFMQDIEFTRSALTAMKEIGCSVSIDDFGTGYSSLAYLKRFPVDNLKIDISFIREMVKDPDSASIVVAIINMAHTLNLKTIAEGIETEEQWNFLRLLRCDMGQGFYLSKPLPADEFVKLLI